MVSIFGRKVSYAPIHWQNTPSLDDMNDPEYSESESQANLHPRKKKPQVTVTLWLFSISISFLLGMALTQYILSNRCLESDLAWGPATRLSARQEIRFDGSFNATNKFKGPPSEMLDREWDRFTYSKWIDGTAVVLAATSSEMKESGNAVQPETVASLGNENGGGSMATLEMFHQLHCLNLLRKWTHVDYYKDKDVAWQIRLDILRDHTDHCIDILRQVLMCNGDMGLIMFHWVKDVGPAPYPDFSTMHRCRDPEAILQEAEVNAAPLVHHVTKTQAAHELPTFP